MKPVKPPPPLPPRDPGIDIGQNHYWRYHSLEVLLACKRPVTASQDEDLFIAVHQICELAFHQMILDLERTLTALNGAEQAAADTEARDDAIEEATYFLRRVVKLYGAVNRTVPILMTMRAFSEFRPSIGPSSGFQSFQFRRLEIMSGVSGPYWTGGTADGEGRLHPAEVEFNRVFGTEVQAWFRCYESHNLRTYFERLCGLASGRTHKEQVTALRGHPLTAQLLVQFREYDEAQLGFHRVHRQLAIQQLELVGVTYGTGGTSFRDYLQRYEREVVPLFAELE
jgi:Tryptophan 2,3-dioxygenase (vermilion)